jgi:5'/3'-nucleotidase SurE
MHTPRILLSNDDGYSYQGIQILKVVLSTEFDVKISAPAIEQSGASHRARWWLPAIEMEEVETSVLKVMGTPCDSLKAALTEDEVFEGCPGWKPDLVIGGMNKGANCGLNVYSSGTVAIAREACHHGYLALSISVDAFNPEPEDLHQAALLCLPLIRQYLTLKDQWPKHTFLNVNVPAKSGIDGELGQRRAELEEPISMLLCPLGGSQLNSTTLAWKLDGKNVTSASVRDPQNEVGDESNDSSDTTQSQYSTRRMAFRGSPYFNYEKTDLTDDFYALSQGHLVITPLGSHIQAELQAWEAVVPLLTWEHPMLKWHPQSQSNVSLILNRPSL